MTLDANTLAVIIGNLLVIGVAWGSLHQRVKSLEREAAALAKFPERLATIEAEIKNTNTKLEQLMGSWLFREPPGYEIGRPPSNRGRRPVTDGDER
jgi:hypothetical protein